MAFTEYRFGPHRWQHFSFFANGSAVTSFINETVDIGVKPWKLAEVRLHFSSVMGSVKYFILRLSSIIGSSHDAILYSGDLNGVQDLIIQYSDPLLFMSGDKLHVWMSVISVANEYGVQVTGWAVID